MIIGTDAAHSGSKTTYVELGVVADRTASLAEERIGFTRPATAQPGRTAILQATIKQTGRRSGLLGARFVPDASAQTLTVSIAVDVTQRANDRGETGLSRIDAAAVLEALEGVAGGAPFRELGPGRLAVDWAVTHPIDSSASAFRDLADRLVPLLALPSTASEEDVYVAWLRQRESIDLSRLFDWLERCIVEHPERGAVFRDGASDAPIADLESSIGLLLPEALRWTAARFDGGRFVLSAAEIGAVEEARQAAGSFQVELLGLDEIREAFDKLIDYNEYAIDCDGWNGKRAIRPRRRAAPGFPAMPWPYVPIAWTPDDHEPLVLEVFDGGRGGRVLRAHHDQAWRDWPVLYESYVKFLEAFAHQGGAVVLYPTVAAAARSAAASPTAAAQPAASAPIAPVGVTALAALSNDVRAAFERSRRDGGGIAPDLRPLATVLWAEYFGYQVTQGGFAQLLYNAEIEQWQVLERTLDTAGALVARRYLAQALALCDDAPDAIQAFRESDFVSENAFKNGLHAVSIAYFQERIDFEREIDGFVAASRLALQASPSAAIGKRDTIAPIHVMTPLAFHQFADRGTNESVYASIRAEPLALRSLATGRTVNVSALAPCTLLFVTEWDVVSARAIGAVARTVRDGVEPLPTYLVYFEGDHADLAQRKADAWSFQRSFSLAPAALQDIDACIGRVPFQVVYAADGRVSGIVEGLAPARTN